MEDNMMVESHGLVAQYITEPKSWRVFAGNREIADIHYADWANDEVDFSTKEAGLLLTSHLNDIRFAFEEKTEGEMVKSDQGIVKDVPDPSIKPEYPDVSPNENQGNKEEIANEVIQLMHELLSDAEANGATKEHVAAIEELEKIYYKATKK
jgi:hypothetical protein